MEDIEIEICNKCNHVIRYKKKKFEFWDDSGYMYSTKYFKCPNCGYLNALGYEEDSWIKENENRVDIINILKEENDDLF